MFKAVFVSNIKRYWWISALCMFFLYVGVIYDAGNYINTGALVISAVIFGGVTGVALFSYMHSQKAINLFHSLPSTKTSIFAANLLFGTLTLLVPGIIASFAATELYLSNTNNIDDISATALILYWVIYSLVFFMLGIFGSMFTGNLAAAIAFVPILAILPFYLESMLRQICDLRLYGTNLASNLVTGELFYGDIAVSRKTLIAFVAVIVLLLIGAYIAYLKRPMEAAGEIVFYGWAKTLFTQGAAFCFGTMVSYTFFNGFSFASSTVIGLIFAAAAMMLVQKTYRIKGFVKQAGLFVAIMLVLFAAIKFDVLGIEARVPEVDEVESVRVNTYYNQNVTLTEREDIAEVTAAHSEAIENRLSEEDADNYVYDAQNMCVRLDYKLKNGLSLSREYEVNRDENAFRDVMMTDSFKRIVFGLDCEWKFVELWDDYGNAVYSYDDIAALRKAIEADLAVADFDALYGDDEECIEFCYYPRNTGSDDHYYRYATVSPRMTNTYACLEELAEKYVSEEELAAEE